jgi:hypothetical protein
MGPKSPIGEPLPPRFLLAFSVLALLAPEADDAGALADGEPPGADGALPGLEP